MGGSGSSIFFPDNSNRRNRAEQLKNDCENAQRDYQTVRQKIAAVLEPLHGELDEVLKALGCNTLAELDQKVLNIATGQVLEDWKKVRDKYDTADKVEGVIWAACGIVSIAGFAISTVMGMFSFGIGFVAGMKLTASISALLGIFGLIFDAINGAVQREKLREAISTLFMTRLRIRQAVDQTSAMQGVISVIKSLYNSVIKAGIKDKETIKQVLVKEGSTMTDNPWTFYKTAKSLNDMDKSRNSWTNEDPNWEFTAQMFDIVQNPGGQIRIPGFPQLNNLTSAVALSQQASSEIPDLSKYEFTTAIPDDLLHDADLKVTITPANAKAGEHVPYFNKPVVLHMDRIISEKSAVVKIEGPDFEGINNKFVIELLAANEAADKAETSVEVFLLNLDMPTQLLLPTGDFSSDKEAGKMVIRYA